MKKSLISFILEEKTLDDYAHEEEELETLKKIALKVRNEFENSLVSYNDEEHGIGIGVRKTLAAYCHLASRRLFELATKEGIQDISFCQGKFEISSKLKIQRSPLENLLSDEEGDDHCWVQYKNWIVDITATQFGFKDKVHITTANDSTYKKIKCERAYFKPDSFEEEDYYVKDDGILCVKGKCF